MNALGKSLVALQIVIYIALAFVVTALLVYFFWFLPSSQTTELEESTNPTRNQTGDIGTTEKQEDGGAKKNNQGCEDGRKLCHDGTCVKTSAFCPKQDETCPKERECGDGSCLSESDLCDGWTDCLVDNKDETNCGPCPLGNYFYLPEHNKCYGYFKEPKTFSDALHFCKTQREGNLATVQTLAHHSWLLDHVLKGDDNARVYIGLTDSLVEGSFRWLEDLQREATFSRWGPGEGPENGDLERGKDLDCVVMNGAQQGLWGEVACDRRENFLCQARAFDEEHSSSSLEYPCIGSGTCIASTKECDGRLDCPGGETSDEHNRCQMSKRLEDTKADLWILGIEGCLKEVSFEITEKEGITAELKENSAAPPPQPPGKNTILVHSKGRILSCGGSESVNCYEYISDTRKWALVELLSMDGIVNSISQIALQMRGGDNFVVIDKAESYGDVHVYLGESKAIVKHEGFLLEKITTIPREGFCTVARSHAEMALLGKRKNEEFEPSNKLYSINILDMSWTEFPDVRKGFTNPACGYLKLEGRSEEMGILVVVEGEPDKREIEGTISLYDFERKKWMSRGLDPSFISDDFLMSESLSIFGTFIMVYPSTVYTYDYDTNKWLKLLKVPNHQSLRDSYSSSLIVI